MKRVLLLLATGFELFEASVFTDVIDWNLEEGDGTTEIISCGLRKEIKSTGGLTVIPELLVSEIDVSQFDALAIPGGYETKGFYRDAYQEDFLELIRKFDQAGKIIASVCVGSLPVGKSGVLKGRCGTTYHLRDGYRQKELALFGVNVLNQPIVIDKNIITSWCPSTAMDVSFKLLEMLTTTENCNQIKYLMGF